MPVSWHLMILVKSLHFHGFWTATSERCWCLCPHIAVVCWLPSLLPDVHIWSGLIALILQLFNCKSWSLIVYFYTDFYINMSGKTSSRETDWSDVWEVSSMKPFPSPVSMQYLDFVSFQVKIETQTLKLKQTSHKTVDLDLGSSLPLCKRQSC